MTPEPVKRATEKGHNVESDPMLPYLHAERWTCISCGDYVIEHEGKLYGFALTVTCEESQRRLEMIEEGYYDD